MHTGISCDNGGGGMCGGGIADDSLGDVVGHDSAYDAVDGIRSGPSWYRGGDGTRHAVDL